MANRIAGITVEIGGDTKKLTSALSGVNKQISSTQTALRDVEKLLKLDPANTELLSQKQKLLKEAISETKDKLASLQEAAASSDLGAAEHDALQREIIETQQKLESLEGKYKDFGSVSKQQLQAVGEKMQEIGKKVSEVGDKIKGFGETLTKKVSAPIAAAGTAAVASFKSVDAGYDTIISKTGATGAALEDLKGQFDDLFATMNVTAEEVGAAVGEVNTRFHLTGDACKETSRAFLEFSKLNNTDVSSSIDTVQKALSAFNMDGSEASTVLDVLNRTGQNTGASVDYLSSSLISNSTALQEMGLDIYGAIGFLGSLETAGADSESVISGMKRALKSATEEGIPFNEALSALQDTIINGTGPMDGLTAAYDLFGKSGAAVYQAVKNGQIDFSNLASTADILADSVGSVSATYEETLDPTDRFRVAMNNLKLTGAELGATLLETLTPAIQKVSNIVQKAREWWEGLSESQQKMIVKIALVAAAIGPVITVIGSVVSGIGSVISVAGTLMSALGALLSPVSLVVAAIAGVVAIGVALYKNWDEISAWASEKWTAIKDTVSGAVQQMKEKISDTWDNVKSKTSETWENIKGRTLEAWTNAKSTVADKVSSMAAAISDKFSLAKTAAVSIFDSIRAGIQSRIEAARDTVKSAIDRIRSFFNFSWSLPHIALPHFSISGSFSLNPPSIPRISVSWYKKAMDNAMVLDNATIFGAAGGRLLGGGEAGREVVSGEGHLVSMIDASVERAIGQHIDGIIRLMERYLPACAQAKVVMPVDTMDGVLAERYARTAGLW